MVAQKRVRDVMSKDVVALSPSETLHTAMELMVQNRVAALPVVNGSGQCLGMLSTSDLVDLTHELDDELHNIGRGGVRGERTLLERLAESLGSEQVSELMSDQVATIGPDATLNAAAEVMVARHVHRLPVVDEDGKLLGILSTMDIMVTLSKATTTVTT